MSDTRISALIALSLISSPIALSANVPSDRISAPSELTTQRTSTRRMKFQLQTAPALKPMGTYVGELQEKWQFPSDHLPIAMNFDDIDIASWNVLDADYMSWVIEKNSQGLSRSQIADEHVYIEGSKLTIRDKHVADLILEMVSHPTHPRSILSLQECNTAFIEELKSRLPANFQIISSGGEAIIIDTTRFELIEAKEVSGVFTNEPHRTFQDVQIRRLDNDKAMRIINGHLPGDPTKPGRFEFAKYIANTFDPTMTTLAMGDMNFDELEMADAMQKAFENDSPFAMYSPYCTNISPFAFNSKAIDHFFVYSPDQASVILSKPSEIMSGLEPIVALLEGKSESIEVQ